MLITLAMLVPICITKPSSPTHPSPKCPTAGGDRRPNLGNTFIDSTQIHEKAILNKVLKSICFWYSQNVFVLAAICISVLIIRIWSLSPCWPIPGCPVQSSQKSSDPQLFPRHTALRCGEITHYVQIKNMKYKKSTYSNPQQSNEQSTLEGPEQIEKIKCKDGLSLLPILCSVYGKCTKCWKIHSVLYKFTWTESRSEVMCGTGQDRTSWLPPIVVPRNWIPLPTLPTPSLSRSLRKSLLAWLPILGPTISAESGVANENNRYEEHCWSKSQSRIIAVSEWVGSPMAH